MGKCWGRCEKVCWVRCSEVLGRWGVGKYVGMWGGVWKNVRGKSVKV